MIDTANAALNQPLKRSLRRHHRERMIAHALRSRSWFPDINDAHYRRWLLKNHDHLQKCSCWLCGNRRKWSGHGPMQERRLDQAAKAALAELP